MKDFYTLADLENWNAPEIRLGVIGDPVAHSRSPQMMNAALQHCGTEIQYARFQIAPNELPRALHLFRQHDFVGANLTIPHKINAAALVDELDEFARAVGAINTVRIADGTLIGHNTDGPGLARAIREEFALELRDLRILILGAGGGAGRAIAHQCVREHCGRLLLANRDFGKAETLAQQLRAEALEWQRLDTIVGQVDLVVNATPAPLPLDFRTRTFDINYTSSQTTAGLTMLLQQGALSFEDWFDRPAPLEIMRGALA